MTTAQDERRNARTAIDQYEGELRENAVDLLTDVLHILDQFGEDPEAAMRMAWHHYVAERDQ